MPDKVGDILISWKFRFSGSPGAISVDNFINRVHALTEQTLDGNFSILRSNASLLFEGKAREFCWRCHKRTSNLQWEFRCNALRKQFRWAIRDRKQREKEGFDSFYDAVVEMMENLEMPLSKMEIVEILKRKFWPEVRQFKSAGTNCGKIARNFSS